VLAAREAGVLVLLKRKRDAAIAIIRDGEGRIMAERWAFTPVFSATCELRLGKPFLGKLSLGESGTRRAAEPPAEWSRSAPSSG
jgi:hypothetical protein